MTEPKPSLFAALVASVEDGVALVLRMPWVVVATAVAFAALRAIDVAVMARFGSMSFSAALWAVPYLAMQAAVATPVTVLVSRNIVLWERLSWDSPRERTQLFMDTFFAIWSTACVILAPTIVLGLLLPPEDADLDPLWGAVMLLAIAASLIWVGLAIVRLLAFPVSVAVGERSASLAASWAVSGKWAWRTAGVLLPVLTCLITLEALWLGDNNAPPHPSPIYAISMGVVDAVSTTILSALAAHVYLWRRSPVPTSATW